MEGRERERRAYHPRREHIVDELEEALVDDLHEYGRRAGANVPSATLIHERERESNTVRERQ